MVWQWLRVPCIKALAADSVGAEIVQASRRLLGEGRSVRIVDFMCTCKLPLKAAEACQAMDVLLSTRCVGLPAPRGLASTVCILEAMVRSPLEDDGAQVVQRQASCLEASALRSSAILS